MNTLNKWLVFLMAACIIAIVYRVMYDPETQKDSSREIWQEIIDDTQNYDNSDIPVQRMIQPDDSLAIERNKMDSINNNIKEILKYESGKQFYKESKA